MRKITVNGKAKSMAQGMNSSSRAQLKRIAQADTNKPREQVPLGNLYARIDKKWVNKGKFCQLCSQPLAFHNEVIDKHRYVCRVLNKKDDENDYQPIVSGGPLIQTPDGIMNMKQAQRFYKVTDQTIRNRIKKKKGWSYANTDN